jgi:thymidylate kinase
VKRSSQSRSQARATLGSGRLIAVDGINGAAVKAAAKKELATIKGNRRGGVSLWDASGVFDDLVVAREDAGAPSARTLMLLYAADLAFRLRWEIRPALAEGRVVAAAPYVATAIAFGRAAGLPADWLDDLFSFAARPDETRLVDTPPARGNAAKGFIEFGCERLAAGRFSVPAHQLTGRVWRQLQRSSPFGPFCA